MRGFHYALHSFRNCDLVTCIIAFYLFICVQHCRGSVLNRGSCEDVTSSCSVVQKINLCDNYYYRRHCCLSCQGSGSEPVVIDPPILNPATPSPPPFEAPTRGIASPNINFVCGNRLETPTFFPSDIPGEFKKRFDDKIVGGIQAKKNQWPWMALLGVQEGIEIKWLCGGSLINERWVLTAAHCITKGLFVRLGEHDIDFIDRENPAIDFKTETMRWYDGYQRSQGYHDIALIKLLTPAPSRFRPVCLPWGDSFNKDYIGHDITVTGWGDENFDAGRWSSVLRQVTITIFNTKRCEDAYKRHRREFATRWSDGMSNETVLCAGHELGGKDSCQGDSGGPMVIGDVNEVYTLVGVVSTGIGCGHENYPGINMPVFAPKYLNWIKRFAFT